MNMLKYHHLFAERGEEEELEAAGEYWQDKDTLPRVSSASFEADKADSPPPKKQGSQTRKGQTVHPYLLKSELLSIDRLRGKNTQKSEIEALIRIGLSVKLGKKHADVLVEPIIEATRTGFQGFFHRFLFLIGIIAYKVQQILYIQERILWLMLGGDEEKFDKFLRDSETSARVNSTRRTPQIDEVIGKLREEIAKGR
jgi:hypothetical protein